MADNNKLDYHAIVDYDAADPAKVLAQKQGRATKNNMPFGFTEVEGTRGESAYVFDMGGMYGAFVQEGLGTKSLVAQEIYKNTGKSYFASIAHDTVAAIINDLISVGATPVVSNAYWSSSSYAWLEDKKLTEDFITGWKNACDKARVVWGGGETQSLEGIVMDGALELAGSAFGAIKGETRLVRETNLSSGDAIILIESNGVHANGISLARKIAGVLPAGYETKLPSGVTFGESLMRPTHIYTDAIEKLFSENIDIHYLSNITGHGWRKLMRATAKFSYDIDIVPPVDEIFGFIAKHSKNSEKEMYGNYNMGAGYAVYLPSEQVEKAIKIISSCGLKAWQAGKIKDGPKQVVIKPKNITFKSESLELR